MNRAEVDALLVRRRLLTGQPFDAEGQKAAAWHRILGPLDPNRVRARLEVLVRQGATEVELGQLTVGMVAPVEDDPDECQHRRTEPLSATGSRCHHCGAEVMTYDDPRIQAQWAGWVAEGRQERDDKRAEFERTSPAARPPRPTRMLP